MEYKFELLNAVELAQRLGCDRKRVYYLDKIGKLGYERVVRRDGKKCYIYDQPFKPVESLGQRLDFSDLEKQSGYLVLSMQKLRRDIMSLSQEFTQKEKEILGQRVKV